MRGRQQVQSELEVQASQERVWEIVSDSSALPRWMPMVKTTDGGRESTGSIRHCRVEMDGRKGNVTEKCIEYKPNTRIAWVMEKDDLGFSKMLSEFGFGFTLIPAGTNATLVRNDTYFRPKNFLASVLVQIFMRRKFQAIQKEALSNLKRAAEGARS